MKPMSKCIHNQNAVMGITLSCIGLLLVSGILLSAMITTVYLNGWRQHAEIQAIATRFSTVVEGIDTYFYEDTIFFVFPEKKFSYEVMLSTESIVVFRQTTGSMRFLAMKRFLPRLWPRSENDSWQSGEELHQYLAGGGLYGHTGNQSDPVPRIAIDALQQERETANGTYALTPYAITINNPVYLEKIIVFYDSSTPLDGIAEGTMEFLVVYQQ